MSFKKIAISAAVAAAVCAAGMGTLSAMGINLLSCSKNIQPTEKPEDAVNISAVPPSDGSLPAAHTGIENISYMVYVLSKQTAWHSYGYTLSEASINRQKTYTYKDYEDGVLVVSDMTSSTFVKSSSQTLYIGDDAYIRSGSEPAGDDIGGIVWNDGAPERLAREDYYLKYGLFGDEISVFLLNESTVSSCGEVTLNDDGTYTQAFTLDPAASTYYYQYNMKTRGGLSSYPEFTSVNVSFTFNDKWEVLKIVTDEVANVTKGAISTKNVSNSEITFSYGTDSVDRGNLGYYDSYFKEYVGNVDAGGGEEEDGGITVMDVLQYGFADVLGGGAQYEISLDAGVNSYKGYVCAAVDLDRLSLDVASALDLRLSLGRTADEQMLYADFADGDLNVYYSSDFAVNANIAELSLIFQSLTEGGNSSDGAGALDVMLLLSQFTLTEADDRVTLVLDTDDLLSTGVGAWLSLEFTKGAEPSSLTFAGGDIGKIAFGGKETNIGLSLAATDAPIITHDAAKTPADISEYAAGVFDLLQSQIVAAELSFDGDASSYAALGGIKADVSAKINAEGLIVGADVYAQYRSISARLSVYYDYNAAEYGKIYIDLTEFCSKPVSARIYCDVSEAYTNVEKLIGLFSSGRSGGYSSRSVGQSAQLADIVNAVLSVDFSRAVTGLYAAADGIKLGVDLDYILPALGADGIPSLGKAALSLSPDGEFSLALGALGLTACVKAGDGFVTVPDESLYMDAAELLDDVFALLSANSVELSLTAEPADGVTVSLDARLDADALAAEADLGFSYMANGADISARLTAYYRYDSADYGEIFINLYEACGVKTDVRISCGVDAVVSAASVLSGKITADGSSAEAEDILSALLGFDYYSVLTTLVADEGGLALGIDVDGVLSQLGADTGDVSFGEARLVYGDGAFSFDMPEFGLTARVEGSDKTVVLPSDGYLSAEQAVTQIADMLGGETLVLGVELGKDNRLANGLSVVGDINFDVNYNDLAKSRLRAFLTVNYGGAELHVDVYYDMACGKYGNVKLGVTGSGTKIYVTCDVSELAVQLGGLLGRFGLPASENAVAADLLQNLVTLDYTSVITVFSADENGFSFGADVDKLIAGLAPGFDTGTEFGTAQLDYSLADNAFRLAFDELGADFTLTAGDTPVSEPDESYMDAARLAEYLNELLGSESAEIRVDIGGNGSFLGGIEEIGAAFAGLTVGGTVNVRLSDGAVSADLAADYAFDGGEISFALRAFFLGGEVKLNIYDINGAPADMGVSCNADEVSASIQSLLSALGVSGAERAGAAADVVSALGGMDYLAVINGVSGDVSGIRLGVDLDALLGELVKAGVTDASVSGLGEAVLTYSAENNVLSLEASALGISAEIYGGGAVTVPSGSYIDLADAVKFAENIIEQGRRISEASSVFINIDGYVDSYGLKFAVRGGAEISWGNGVSAAFNLTLSIADGSASPDSVKVRFIYSDGGVTLVADKLGITADRSDIEGLRSDFTVLCNAFSAILGGGKNTSGAGAAISAVSGTDGSAAVDALLTDEAKTLICRSLFSFLSGSEWVNALGELSLSASPEEIVLSKLGSFAVTLAAGNGITLIYAPSEGDECSLTVSEGKGLLSDIEKELASVSVTENPDGSVVTENNYFILSSSDDVPFVKALYDFATGAIKNATIGNTLGGDTYAVNLSINGNNSALDATLKNVAVDASLYYTENAATSTARSKLLEADISVRTSFVSVKLNGIFYGDYLYLELGEVNGTVLVGVNVKISSGDFYAIAEDIVGLITSPSATAALSSNGAAAEVALSSAQKDVLSEVICAVLRVNFADYITCYKNTASGSAGYALTIDVDGLALALGASAPGLGTITAEYDGATRAITARGEYEGRIWFSGSAGRTSARTYADFDTEAYIDLAFVGNLVGDGINFATDDDGNFYESYTFSGSITAGIDIKIAKININIDVLNLTAGFKDGGAYFSMTGALTANKVIGVTLTQAWNFGITYSDGKIVAGRKLGTSSAEYKIMTVSYFTDALLTSDSPLCWLLGTDSWIWNLIVGSVGVTLDSGVTGAGTYAVGTANGGETSVNGFAAETVKLSSYLSGVKAVINGETVVDDRVYGSGGANVSAGKLGLTDNYYAFDLNNSTLAALTNDGITELYAAILRSDAQGICGLKASGYIGGVMSFAVNLDKYEEGLTDVYNAVSDSGTVRYEAAAADKDNMFTEATDASAEGVSDYYVLSDGVYVKAQTFEEGVTYYTPAYYEKTEEGYIPATGYAEGTQYYTATLTTDISGFAAPDMLAQLTEYLAGMGVAVDYGAAAADNGTRLFGCYDVSLGGGAGTYTYQYAPAEYSLKIYYPGNTDADPAEVTHSVRYGANVTLYKSDNRATLGGKDGAFAYYIYGDDGEKLWLGDSFTFDDSLFDTGNAVIYAEFRYKVNVVLRAENTGESYKIDMYEGDLLEGMEYGGNYVDILSVSGNDDNCESITITDTPDRTVTIECDLLLKKTSVNGVYYTYDFGNRSYTVTGYDADLAGVAGAKFTLENTVCGKPVTEIAEGALSGAFVADGGTAYSQVRMLVVPENICTIGGKAFADNTALSAVVFLADKINLYCTDDFGTGLGEPQGFPFYGCNSSLTAYYNEVWAEDTTSYVLFVSYNNKGLDYCWQYATSNRTSKNINAVNGSWCLLDADIIGGDDEINAVINGYLADNGIVLSGINGVKVTAEGLAAQLSDAVNAYLLENYGYAGDYRITAENVTSVAGGRYSQFDINVACGYGRYYLLEISGDGGAVDVLADTGDLYVYGGGTYVKSGADIILKVTPNGGTRFIGFVTSDGSDFGNEFTMPDGALALTAVYETYFTELTLKSEVAFTYDGVNYDAGDAVIEGEYTETSVLSVPYAEGYTFIGWAYAGGSGFVFASDGKTVSDTYYAIWAYDTGVEVAYTKGSDTVTASVSGGKVYGWYSDAGFTDEVSQGDTVTVSPDNTLLCARGQFELALAIGHGGLSALSDTSFVYIYENDVCTVNKQKISGISGYTFYLAAYQGDFSFEYTDGIIYIRSGAGKYRIEVYERSGVGAQKGLRALEFSGDTGIAYVSGNISITAKDT